MAEDRVEKFTDIFVKGLGEDLNDEKLKEHFACFGAIVDCKVMVDKYGKNKGYGFVSFKEHDAAEKAVAEMNNAELEGRSIIVSRYLTKAEHKQQRRAQPHPTQSSNDSNLYVKNLDETIDNEALLREFSPYGTITSAKVMMENGRSKKYGFVCFSSPEEAEKAMTEMNGKILLSKPLYVALAQRKAERKAELKARQDAFYIHGRRDIRSQQAFVGNPKYFTPRGSSRFSSPANMYPALPNPILGAQSTGQQPADMSNQANAISRQTNFQVEEQTTPLTAGMLSELPHKEQKQMLGQRLFPLLREMFPNYAPKLTGMLLEINNSELLDMLADQHLLKSTVNNDCIFKSITPVHITKIIMTNGIDFYHH